MVSGGEITPVVPNEVEVETNGYDLDLHLQWCNEQSIRKSLGYLGSAEFRRSLGLAPRLSKKTSAVPIMRKR